MVIQTYAAESPAVTAGAGERPRICAVLASHNRREMTLRCLDALGASAGAAGVSLSAVVVDDGSDDGTAAAVAERYPWATVFAGDGHLYWCRAMHRAFAVALESASDHYLWLNDDTVLEADGVERLLACHADLALRRAAPLIVVGGTADPATGSFTYGGERRPSRWRPLHVVSIAPARFPQRCDSMTGNIALVSAAAADRVGNLDAAFEHAMGDTDYAFRAIDAGVEIWLAPGTLGLCRANEAAGTYRDRSLPIGERWRRMLDRKGLPWRSWLRFSRRHGGVLWPIAFAWPYVSLLASGLVGGRARSTRP